MYAIKDGLIYKNGVLLLPFNFDKTTFLDTMGNNPLDGLELAISGIIDTNICLDIWRVYNTPSETIIAKYTIIGLTDIGKGEYGVTLVVRDSAGGERSIAPYCMYTIEQVQLANSKAVYAELLSVEKHNSKLTIQNNFIKEIFGSLKFDLVKE